MDMSEVCAQECAYFLLGLSFVICDSSVIFIDTEKTHKRTRISLPKSKLKELDPDETNVYEEGLIERYEKDHMSLKI